MKMEPVRPEFGVSGDGIAGCRPLLSPSYPCEGGGGSKGNQKDASMLSVN